MASVRNRTAPSATARPPTEAAPTCSSAPTDLTLRPDTAEPVELLPLSVVATELAELGIGTPDDLARHVGPERIVVVADLVRCVTAGTVAELATELAAVRARRAEANRRYAEQIAEAQADLSAVLRGKPAIEGESPLVSLMVGEGLPDYLRRPAFEHFMAERGIPRSELEGER